MKRRTFRRAFHPPRHPDRQHGGSCVLRCPTRSGPAASPATLAWPCSPAPTRPSSSSAPPPALKTPRRGVAPQDRGLPNHVTGVQRPPQRVGADSRAAYLLHPSRCLPISSSRLMMPQVQACAHSSTLFLTASAQVHRRREKRAQAAHAAPLRPPAGFGAPHQSQAGRCQAPSARLRRRL